MRRLADLCWAVLRWLFTQALTPVPHVPPEAPAMHQPIEPEERLPAGPLYPVERGWRVFFDDGTQAVVNLSVIDISRVDGAREHGFELVCEERARRGGKPVTIERFEPLVKPC